MKPVKITLNLFPEQINKHLNKIRQFKELLLIWCIEGSSPADFPEVE